MGAYGDLWGPVGAYGDPWGPLGAHGGLWGPVGACGDSLASMVTFGDPLAPMGTFGDLWGPLGTYRVLWGPIGTYWHLWGPMGTSRGLWGPMRWGASTFCTPILTPTPPPLPQSIRCISHTSHILLYTLQKQHAISDIRHHTLYTILPGAIDGARADGAHALATNRRAASEGGQCVLSGPGVADAGGGG